jgi:hypothetical protein
LAYTPIFPSWVARHSHPSILQALLDEGAFYQPLIEAAKACARSRAVLMKAA